MAVSPTHAEIRVVFPTVKKQQVEERAKERGLTAASWVRMVVYEKLREQ